jgi:hypothetical protein
VSSTYLQRYCLPALIITPLLVIAPFSFADDPPQSGIQPQVQPQQSVAEKLNIHSSEWDRPRLDLHAQHSQTGPDSFLTLEPLPKGFHSRISDHFELQVETKPSVSLSVDGRPGVYECDQRIHVEVFSNDQREMECNRSWRLICWLDELESDQGEFGLEKFGIRVEGMGSYQSLDQPRILVKQKGLDDRYEMDLQVRLRVDPGDYAGDYNGILSFIVEEIYSDQEGVDP